MNPYKKSIMAERKNTKEGWCRFQTACGDMSLKNGTAFLISPMTMLDSMPNFRGKLRKRAISVMVRSICQVMAQLQVVQTQQTYASRKALL